MFDRTFVISGNTFESADSDRFFINSAAAAGGFAGTVAYPPENSGKNIRHPVNHIGVFVLFVIDHPDVFRYCRMGRAGVLTVDDLMKIFRILYIGRFQGVAS